MAILYVSSLPKGVTEAALKDIFSPFGHVIAARVLYNSEGCSLGCGVVTMLHKEEVDEILATKDRISVAGKRPNIWRGHDVPKRARQSMELLLQWPCKCEDTKCCPECGGKSYVERWTPIEFLPYLRGFSYVIRGRRYIGSSPKNKTVV